jgi:transcriptional regulator with XRE-family HTH domain
MTINRKDIGERIVKARTDRGFPTTASLATRLRELFSKRPPKNGTKRARIVLARQTVSNWESGDITPPIDALEALAEVLGEPYGEEWIMFGERRDAQLAAERGMLVRLTLDEADLVNEYRHANEQGRKSALEVLRGIAKSQPIPAAHVHNLRRRSDG